MQFLEKDLETLIWDAYKKNSELLVKRGLNIYGHPFRQLNLGSYGIADIVTFQLLTYKGHRKLRITVYELKKDVISTDTLLQALKYCKGIERTITKKMNLSNVEFVFNIVLIGKYIDLKSEFVYLADYMNNLSLITYHADIESGFIFKDNRGYCQNKDSSGSLPDKADLMEILFKQHYYREYAEEIL